MRRLTSDQVYRDEIRHLKEMQKTLVKIGIQLSKEKNTEKLLDMILDESISLTCSDAGSIYVSEHIEGRDYLLFKTSINHSVPFRQSGDRLPINRNSIAGYVALTGEPLLMRKNNDADQASLFTYNTIYSEKYKYKPITMMSIPMKDHKGNVVGVLQILNKKIQKTIHLDQVEHIEDYIEDYTEDEKELLLSLAAQTAILLDRARLSQQLEKSMAQTRSTMINLFYNMKEAMVSLGDDLLVEQEEFKRYATTDELTGLLTRREGLSCIQKQIELARVNNLHVTIGFIDVNGLKQVNDTYGHQEGDALLTIVTQILKMEVRSNDTVIRYGGDEFVIVLYNTSTENAKNAWNRIMEKFNAYNQSSTKPYLVSASHGFSEYIPGGSEDIEILIRAADEIMYREKTAFHTLSSFSLIDPPE